VDRAAPESFGWLTLTVDSTWYMTTIGE